MAASTGLPPRFLHHHPAESISLRSFRVNVPASSAASTASAPSLKAASLKVRSARAFAHLLGSRGRPAFPAPDEPRLADLTYPSDFPSKSLPSKMPQLPKNSTPPQLPQPLSPPAAAPPAMQAHSKSRTIIRMLTTKFTPRSSPSSTSPTANLRRGPTMPAPPNAFNAERRAAALRERGLLPPLPSRDLSTQEMERDQRLPIVSVGTDGAGGLGAGGDDGALSAADLIKREWEAKNSAVNATSPGGANGAENENGDAPVTVAATTPTPVSALVDGQPVDAEALSRERMRGFRFGGGSTPPSPNPGLESQHQLLDQHQEDRIVLDKAESSADPTAKAHDRPLPVPPRAPSPSFLYSSPPAPVLPPLSSSPVALSPLSALFTSISTYASTAPLTPPPTDALPPLPPSPIQSSPSRSSTLSRPLPSPPATPSPTSRQIHPDLQAFTFPLPPSPAASAAPAFVLNLSEAAGRPSGESESSSSTLDHPAPGGMDAWAAALPPIPPSPAPSVRSTRSVVSLRSGRGVVQGPRAAALPMPSSSPPPTPVGPSAAQVQAQMRSPPLSPSLVPLPSSPLPPAISLTPPVGVGMGAAHARDDSFALLEASMNLSGALSGNTARESADSESGGGAGASTSGGEGLHDGDAANGARALQFPSASASPSPSPSEPASHGPTTPRTGIPKGKLGALTVQTRAVAVAAPVLVVVESPPPTGGSVGGRWAEELAVVVEEHEGDLSGSGSRSMAGSVTPTPSLGAATAVGVGGTTPTSASTTAASAVIDVFEAKASADVEGRRTSEDSSAESDDSSNPAQYVYARPAGAAAPLVASPLSSSHSHSLSHASSTASSSSSAAARLFADGSVPLTPATFAARVPLPPTPTSPALPLTPSIRVSSPTGTGNNGKRARARGATDPTAANGTAEKKKTFNPFKRSASALASSGGDGPTRRLSVAASLSAHLRRSMTAAAASSAAGNGHGGASTRTFDASHLPPSPTPQRTGFAAVAATTTAAPGANGGKVVRQPVAPMVYTHGSILAAANAIEDEESRRMTEMAFLG